MRSARPRDTDRGTSGRDTLRAWSELLRVSALFTVPGDALAGAAAVGLRPNRGTALALGASLCLYEAGMALNDWADRDEDAIDRPHRPIPSGRITPPAALAAAAVLTATGLTLASRAGRPALTAATALAATVWAYDLRLKHTKAGPAAMAAARSLDLLLGAVATATASTAHRTSNTPSPAPRGAVTDEWTSDGWASGGGPAGRGTTTLASGRRNPPHLDGCSPASPSLMAAALAEPAPTGPAQEAGAAVTGPPPAETASTTTGPPASTSASTTAPTGTLTSALPAALVLGAHTYAVTSVSRHEVHGGSTLVPLAALATALGLGLNAVREGRPLNTALAGTYIRAAGVPFLHAALNPSPQLTQGAVGGGIRAMIPLQAVIAARAGGGAGNATALALTALVPLARKLARKVSPT
ncbi:UbiA family prenyltransferase [Streptomyces sp. NPDC004726]